MLVLLLLLLPPSCGCFPLCRADRDTHREAEVVRTERRVAFCMEACIVVLWRRGGANENGVKEKK